LRSGPGAAGYTLPADYQRGWKEGYVDYMTYGNSGDPRVASRTRTSSSEEWLAGFRDGMTTAYTAIASEYPTLVATATPPLSPPGAAPEVEYRPFVASKGPTVESSAALPPAPVPPIEKRVPTTPAAPMFQAPPLPPKSDVQQPAMQPPSAPRQSQPFTRMANGAPAAAPVNSSVPQGMPLPGGLRADEVSQSQIWATGQQPWTPQQPTIVRLPDTGENAYSGMR
jgi:hypothetical protein